MSKRILVTGGAGFLGSHLCEKLLNEGNFVICIDNLLTGSKKNINLFKKTKNFEFINHDITFPVDLNIDEIYNLACPASPVHYQDDPIKTIKTSFLGSLNMLELADKNNAKILQTSTSEIYGDPEIHPQIENYWGNVNPIGIRSCYDEGKRCAETLFFDFWRQKKIKIKVARIFNTYGPRMLQNDGRVISNFIIQALKNEDITLYGDGSQTRSFCFYSDMISALIKLMNSNNSVTGPVNLGNPTEYTILELAELVISLTASKSKIKHLKLPQDDPKRRKPSIELASKTLNWSPEIDIKHGLKETIHYFEKLLIT